MKPGIDTGKFDNNSLHQAEEQKYSKHELPYAAARFSFFPFVGSCFGTLGTSAVRYLWSLAWLNARMLLHTNYTDWIL